MNKKFLLVVSLLSMVNARAVDNAQATTTSYVAATADFLNKNVVAPTVKAGTFLVNKGTDAVVWSKAKFDSAPTYAKYGAAAAVVAVVAYKVYQAQKAKNVKKAATVYA